LNLLSIDILVVKFLDEKALPIFDCLAVQDRKQQYDRRNREKKQSDKLQKLTHLL